MFKSFRSLRKFSMQHLTKDILTTKITKATKGSDIFDYKLRAPFDFAQGMLRVLRGQICFSPLSLFWLWPCRTRFSVVKYVCLGLVLFASPIFPPSAFALEVPALNTTINDFAKMMRPASVDDLTERLKRMKTQSAYTVTVLTVPSLEDEDIESFGRKAFKNLPLTEKELQRVSPSYRRSQGTKSRGPDRIRAATPLSPT